MSLPRIGPSRADGAARHRMRASNHEAPSRDVPARHPAPWDGRTQAQGRKTRDGTVLFLLARYTSPINPLQSAEGEGRNDSLWNTSYATAY